MEDKHMEEEELEGEQSEDGRMETGQPVNQFASAIFTVLAGPGHKPLFAHASVLSKSAIFSKIIDGDWKESQDRVINLEDWDVGTVARLLEFLYTNDYACPLPIGNYAHEKRHVDPIQPSDHVVDNSRRERRSITKLMVGPKHYSCESQPVSYIVAPRIRINNLVSRRLRNIETSLPYDDCPQSHHHDFKEWASTVKPWCKSFDSRSPMIAHARLHVLATYVILPALEKISLNRFGITMNAHIVNNTFIIGSWSSQVMADVVRYVYANTRCMEGGKEPMRQLVSTFLVARMKALDEEVLNTLLEEGGDCAVDVLRHLKKIALDWDEQTLDELKRA